MAALVPVTAASIGLDRNQPRYTTTVFAISARAGTRLLSYLRLAGEQGKSIIIKCGLTESAKGRGSLQCSRFVPDLLDLRVFRAAAQRLADHALELFLQGVADAAIVTRLSATAAGVVDRLGTTPDQNSAVLAVLKVGVEDAIAIPVLAPVHSTFARTVPHGPVGTVPSRCAAVGPAVQRALTFGILARLLAFLARQTMFTARIRVFPGEET
jgi:hypothetical protein